VVGALLDGHGRPPRLGGVDGVEDGEGVVQACGVVALESFAGGRVDGGDSA
jgi:hypothetical protein